MSELTLAGDLARSFPGRHKLPLEHRTLPSGLNSTGLDVTVDLEILYSARTPQEYTRIWRRFGHCELGSGGVMAAGPDFSANVCGGTSLGSFFGPVT
jgi:hypothetical protein